MYTVLRPATVCPGGRSGLEGAIPSMEVESVPKLAHKGDTCQDAVLGKTDRIHVDLGLARMVCRMVRGRINETWNV